LAALERTRIEIARAAKTASRSAATYSQEKKAMTGLRTWQKIARSLVIAWFVCEVAATIGSLVLLVLVMVQGDGGPSLDRLISIIGTLGLYGVVIWAIWDARRWRRRPPLKRVANAEEAV
jgi:hypothetical protein